MEEERQDKEEQERLKKEEQEGIEKGGTRAAKEGRTRETKKTGARKVEKGRAREAEKGTFRKRKAKREQAEKELQEKIKRENELKENERKIKERETKQRELKERHEKELKAINDIKIKKREAYYRKKLEQKQFGEPKRTFDKADLEIRPPIMKSPSSQHTPQLGTEEDVKDTKKIFNYFSGNSNSSSQGPTPVIRLPDRCHCAANDQVW